MKRLFTLWVFLCVFAIAQTVYAAPVAYISGGAEPWNQPGGVNGMNDVFGAGNWDRLDFGNAVGNGIFDGGYDYLYIDGGDGQTGGWEGFINSYRSDLETYVSNGGNLFLNAARWGGTNNFDLGFGANLVFGTSNGGHAADGTDEVFNGPYGATGEDFTGSYFSHDYITGTGLNDIILDDLNRTILADMDYGSGHVMFGGLTLAFFGEHGAWSPTSGILRNNILDYGNNPGTAPVPEPSTIILLGSGLAGLAFWRRRQA